VLITINYVNTDVFEINVNGTRIERAMKYLGVIIADEKLTQR